MVSFAYPVTRAAQRGLGALACALMLAGSALPAEAGPAAQVAPSAPENLRCPGRPAPPLPGPGWQASPVWAWQDFLHVEGTVGSNDGPYAVAVDRQCNVYVADSQHYRVLKLNQDGAVTGQIALPGERAPGESSSPRGVAVDGQGNIYATDTTKDRVYKFAPEGNVLNTWGACPDGGSTCDSKLAGRFQAPEGIAVDGAGNVYVAEAAGLRIQKLPARGDISIWDLKGKGIGELFIPGSLSIDQGGFVYLSEGYGDMILKFDPSNGALAGRWGGTKSGEPGQFQAPLGVGVDAAGNMYVADTYNWRVQKLGPNGGFLDQWRNCLDGDPPCQLPDAGAEPGQFMAARGIAVDGQGTVYVADTANKRIQRLMIVDWELIPPPSADDEAE
jgi:DNA-binding beta-propeller fold protein YncE